MALKTIIFDHIDHERLTKDLDDFLADGKNLFSVKFQIYYDREVPGTYYSVLVIYSDVKKPLTDNRKRTDF